MIRLEGAHFAFGGGKPILEGVDLTLPEGARVGLLGRNGAGKTTLFRLIQGQLSLDAGTVNVPKGRRIVYLPQHPTAPAGDTILRNVLESHPTLHDLEDQILRVEAKMAEADDPGRLDRLVERHRALARDFEQLGGYDLEARVTSILHGLGFEREDLLGEISSLSPGERNRVALARILLAQGDLLLLDEPTNHLDFEMVEWLEDYLTGSLEGQAGCPVTVLVASHDRWFLNRVVNHVAELRAGRLYLYRGNYDEFARQRAEEIDRQDKEHRLQRAEISREEEFIRRNFAAQKARQAKSREKKLRRMEVVERPVTESSGPKMRFTETPRGGDDVLRVEGFACGYGANVLVEDARLELIRGERVAIVGPNGCGKTTLLRCLVDRLQPLGGKVQKGKRTVIGYYEQEHAEEHSSRAVFDEVHDLIPRASNQQVFDLLAAFLFRGDEVLQSTASLSGGEKARLALLRLILSGANLLVLDEPTNHLDVYARAALEESLLEFPETVLFVSHDRYFVERIADRVLAVEGAHLREYAGGYSDYRQAWRAEEERRRGLEAEERRLKSRRGAGEGGAPAKDASKARKVEERIFEAIAKCEEEIRSREAECGKEENYKSPDAMKRLHREIQELRARLDDLYRKWEESAG